MHKDFQGNDEIRKQLSVFQSIFSEIYVTRKDNTKTEVNRFYVPIEYGPKKKYIRRIEGKFDVPQGITLPRLTFELTSLNLSATRRRNPIQRAIISKHLATKTNKKHVLTPIHYDFNISMGLYIKNEMDGFQILNQISSVFQPHYKVDAALFEDDLETTLPLIFKLVGTTPDQNYEGSYEERQTKFWTFDFILMGYLFTDVYSQTNVSEINIGVFNTDNISETQQANSSVPETTTLEEISSGQEVNIENVTESNLVYDTDLGIWVTADSVEGLDVTDSGSVGVDAGGF